MGCPTPILPTLSKTTGMRHPDGNMRNIESTRGYPKIWVPVGGLRLWQLVLSGVRQQQRGRNGHSHRVRRSGSAACLSVAHQQVLMQMVATVEFTAL